jgi:hypothetical protein
MFAKVGKNNRIIGLNGSMHVNFRRNFMVGIVLISKPQPDYGVDESATPLWRLTEDKSQRFILHVKSIAMRSRVNCMYMQTKYMPSNHWIAVREFSEFRQRWV